MNKKELVKAVSAKTYYSQGLIREILDSALNVVAEEVSEGNEVRIGGFGKFYRQIRSARKFKGFDGRMRSKREYAAPYFKPWGDFKSVIEKSYKKPKRKFSDFFKPGRFA